MTEIFDRARRRRAQRAGAAALLIGLSCGDAAAGDAAHGEVLYEGCQDCHSLDKNDVGPRHRGVFGRKAGSLPDYEYSDALKQSGIVWNAANLDKWLTDPQSFIPGVKMFYHLDDEKNRADVIAFLAERAR
jgi:cytochrome c